MEAYLGRWPSANAPTPRRSFSVESTVGSLGRFLGFFFWSLVVDVDADVDGGMRVSMVGRLKPAGVSNVGEPKLVMGDESGVVSSETASSTVDGSEGSW